MRSSGVCEAASQSLRDDKEEGATAKKRNNIRQISGNANGKNAVSRCFTERAGTIDD
jgi:hypothetical protein